MVAVDDVMNYEDFVFYLRLSSLAAVPVLVVALIADCLRSRERRTIYRFTSARVATSAVIIAAFLLTLRWDFGYGRWFTFAGFSRGAFFVGVRDEPPPGERWFWEPAAPGTLVLTPRLFYGLGPYCGVSTPFGSTSIIGNPWAPFCGVGAPLWVLVVGIYAAPLLARIRGRPPLPYECRKCGYNLTGNVSGVCPECGGTIRDA